MVASPDTPKTLGSLGELVYCVSGRFSVRARARSFCGVARAGGRARARGHFGASDVGRAPAGGRVCGVILAPATWGARRRAGACAASHFGASDAARAPAGGRVRGVILASATWSARRRAGACAASFWHARRPVRSSRRGCHRLLVGAPGTQVECTSPQVLRQYSHKSYIDYVEPPRRTRLRGAPARRSPWAISPSPPWGRPPHPKRIP